MACGKTAKWQINQPGKASLPSCNEHLGGMIEGQMPKTPGTAFSFQLVWLASIEGFNATCLHTEVSTKAALAAESGEQKVVKGPELPLELGASSSVEVK